MKRDRLEMRTPRKDRKMEVTIKIPDNLAAEARARCIGRGLRAGNPGATGA